MANSRRTFLKNVGAGSLSATLMPLGLSAGNDTTVHANTDALPPDERQFNSPYKNEFLSRIAFPLGGIGAGMFCIEGTGAFSHMSIRHKPDVFSEPGMFAAIAIEGQPDNGAKILEGPAP